VTAVSIARYLAEFGNIEPPREVIAAPEIPPAAPDEPVSHIDVAQLTEEAHARGVEEGRAAAQTAFDAALAEERKSIQSRTILERSKWRAHEGQRLSEALGAAVERLKDEMAASLARILQPFLIAKLREEMVGALREALAAMLLDDRSPLIRISGPEDILNGLREGMEPSMRAIEFVPADSVDVTIVAQDTVIESQLRAWMARFDGRLD
jgi:hypothetical protein